MVKSQIKKLLPSGLFRMLEPSYHFVEAAVASARYGRPARDMNVIGVTGTNGKTTTCFMIHRMLTEAGYKTGMMTTVAYGVGSDIKPQVVHMTTVSAPVLQKRLAEFRRAGVEWLILEVTSHALAQYRTLGIPIEIAVVTNVTHEHLDYHRTFERYLEAKTRLFRYAKRLGVVNADDPHHENFSRLVKRSVSYGLNAGDVRAMDVELLPDKSTYTVDYHGEKYNVTCRIPGEFNVYNSLAAIAVGEELGLTREQIENGIAALEGVEGRMDVVDEGQPFTVVVDFAHTPDSFERLLGDIRRSTKGKLVVLFGSAGRRDESKRAIQGEIAGRLADELILTEEDDRDVDGNEILDQIAEGAAKSGKVVGRDVFLELDRTEAIKLAITRVSDADDTVVFLGKGHEKTIERADGEHPWNEIEVVRDALRNRGK